MLVAEQQFRRIIGYRDLAKLVIAIERHADRVKLANANTVTTTHTQVSEVVTADCQSHVEVAAKFHDDPDILYGGHPPISRVNNLSEKYS